ncbi:mobilization protein, partial [Helicobacter sp. T3_23-1056]
MGQISSIHLKPSKDFNVWHNADIRPSYAIDSSGRGLWFNRNGLEAQQLKEQIIKQAKEQYEKHCKARNKAFQAKSYEWSAVVNLKPDSTQDDLEKLAKHFSDKYGFQCY